jgi:hypothetical protein
VHKYLKNRHENHCGCSMRKQVGTVEADGVERAVAFSSEC